MKKRMQEEIVLKSTAAEAIFNQPSRSLQLHGAPQDITDRAAVAVLLSNGNFEAVVPLTVHLSDQDSFFL